MEKKNGPSEAGVFRRLLFEGFKALFVGVVGLLLGLFGRDWNRDPVVHATCEPTRGPAPLMVTCRDYSEYVDKVRWLWNDNSPPVEAQPLSLVSHEYAEPGAYTLRQVGIGKKNVAFERSIAVEEGPTVVDLPEPITVTIVGTLAGETIRIRHDYPVSYTKSDHPSLFGSSTAPYSHHISAVEGHRVVEAAFYETSGNNVSDRNFSWDQEGATLAFTLTSGPQVDQYRGWLAGTVSTVQERTMPDTSLEIVSELVLTQPGIVPLSGVPTLESFRSITFETENGADLGPIGARETALLLDRGVALSLTSSGGIVALRVERVAARA